jgi:hypothetical protein
MRSRVALVSAAIALAWIVRAQESGPEKAPGSRPVGGEDLVAAVEDEFKSAQDAFFKEYRQAKTDEEKDKLYKEKYPRAERWFPRLLAAAKADPKSKRAEKALVWAATHMTRAGEGTEAIEILARDHFESADVAPLADAMVYSPSPKADELLVALETKNPNREIKGRALYARAERRKNASRSAERVQGAKTPKDLQELEEDFPPDELARLKALDVAKNAKEVEALLERVQKEFVDVDAGYGGTLGDRAGGDLFEMRNLAIGKVAPDIVGEGVDGKPLKLSEFKGKVVVLDFWGNW